MTNTEIDRSEFRNENGLARWWQKDGAWHVARHTGDQLLWTNESYRTRDEAVAALKVQA